MSALHLTSLNFDKAIADGRVLVDFWAEWCGPCKMLNPVIEELIKEFEGRATIARVNIDEEKALIERFKIMSVPTVVIFNDGEETKRFIGVKTKEEYVAELEK